MLSAERIEEIAKRQGFDAEPADAVRLDSEANSPEWEEIEAWRVGEAVADAVRHQEKLGTDPIGNARLAELAGTTTCAISENTRRSDELAFALDRNGEGTRMAFRSKLEKRVSASWPLSPAFEDHPAGAVIRDPNPRELPATRSAPPVERRASPAGAFSPPR